MVNSIKEVIHLGVNPKAQPGQIWRTQFGNIVILMGGLKFEGCDAQILAYHTDGVTMYFKVYSSIDYSNTAIPCTWQYLGKCDPEGIKLG